MALDVGELQATITINTDALKAVTTAFNRLEPFIDKLTKSVDNLASVMEKRVGNATQVVVKSTERQAKAYGLTASNADAAAKKLEQTYDKQTRSLEVTEEKVKRLAAAYSQLEGGAKFAGQATQAFEVFKRETDNGKVSAEAYRVAQDRLKLSLEKTKTEVTKAHPSLNRFNLGLTEMSKTAVIALGPLNGVAARITAIAGIAKASAIPIATLFAGMAGFAVLMSKSIKAGANAESMFFKMAGSLKLMGNEANTTVQELNAMAIAVAEGTLASTQGAREAAVALAAFKGISTDAMEATLFLAQDLTEVLGGSLIDNAKKMGRVWEDPISALDTLARSGIKFTNQQKELVAELVRTGRAAEASKVVFDDLNRRVGGQARNAAKGLAGAWDTLGERMTKFVEAVGGMETKGGTLANTITNIANQLDRFSQAGGLAENIGSMMASTLNFLAEAFFFAAKHSELLLSALTAFTIGGIGIKVVKSFVAMAEAAKLAGAATGVMGVAIGKLTLAIRALMAATGVGVLALIAGFAVEYLVFGKNAKEAAKEQSELNKQMERQQDIIKGTPDPSVRLREEKALIEARLALEKDTQRNLIKMQEAYLEKTGSIQGARAFERGIAEASARVSVLEQSLQSLNAQLNEIGFQKASNELELQISQYQTLQDVVFDSASEVRKYNEALQIASTVNLEAAKSSEKFKDAQGNFDEKKFNEFKAWVQSVKDLAKTNGFIKAFQEIEQLNKGLAKSKTLRDALFSGGLEGLIIAEQFATISDSIDKYSEALFKAHPEELATRASWLGLNVEGLNREQTILAIAAAQAKLSEETRKNNEVTARQKELLTEIRNIEQALAVASVAGEGFDAMFNRAFTPEKVKRMEDLKRESVELAQGLKDAIAGGDTEAATRAMWEYWELADKIGMQDPFAGVDFTNADAVAEAFAKIRQRAKDLELGYDELNVVQNNIFKDMAQATQSWSAAATDALSNFVKTGKADFSDFAKSVIDDMIRITIQRNIMDTIFGTSGREGWFSGLFKSAATTMTNASANAKGGAFVGGTERFAKGGAFTNSIVNRPTLFPMKRGAGLMGEAGPEAIMPLTRTSGGDLGVKVEGLGGGDTISIVVNVDSGGGVNTQGGENGGQQLGKMIGNAVRAVIVAEKRPGGLLN